MKQNFLAGFLAIIMVFLAAGALYGAMTVYEQDQFDESWTFNPAVIENEIKPLYSEEFDANSTEY